MPIECGSNIQGIRPFAYLGGKFSKLNFILPILIPKHRHVGHFIDGFCGSAAVALNRRDPNTTIVTINDLNSDIVNFFEQLRDNSEELLQLIALTPYSREDFERHSAGDWQGKSAVERARLLYAHVTQSFAGQPVENASWASGRKGGVNNKSCRASSYANNHERVCQVVKALRPLFIENRPVMDLLRRYGESSNTMLYLDPPYLVSTADDYRGEFSNTEQDHIDLLVECNKAEAMIAISHYPNDVYTEHLQGWRCFSYETLASVSNARDLEKDKRTELLYTNYEPKIEGLQECLRL